MVDAAGIALGNASEGLRNDRPVRTSGRLRCGPMTTEDPRTSAAHTLRDLNHSFVVHDPDEATLAAFRDAVGAAARVLDATPRRDRQARMQASAGELGFPVANVSSGFEDRAVGGIANPTGVELTVRFEGEEVVAEVRLRRAFEGAPGRAHGGIVAAAFDDVTGFVIGLLREPAFTGELTVRYVAPVPVDAALEMRARLESRERRKLFITGEARHEGNIVATCRAIYITVDPARFAGAPEPR